MNQSQAETVTAPSPTGPTGHRGGRVGFLGFLLLFCPEASAEIKTFSIDTNRSVIQLRGTVLAFGLNLVLNDQAPGSRLVPWQGTLTVAVSTNAIQFLGDNWLPLLESGSWEPDTNGVPGFAPGNYGLKPAATLGGLKIDGRAACRQWGFETISTNLAMQNGQFAMRPVFTRFVSAANSAVDYRFVLTTTPVDPDIVSNFREPSRTSHSENPTIVAGRAWMSGMLTNRTTLKGQLSLVDGLETLTLPLEGWYSFSTQPGQYVFRFDMILEGQLVATRIPVIESEPPAQPGGPLRLSWPPGYRLQRATGSAPQNWIDDAIIPPLEIVTGEPAEYFRAIRYLPLPAAGANE